MPQLEYDVVQKPLDRRLEEAACIYYDVERVFFYVKQKGKCKDREIDKRRILFWLLRTEAGMDYTEIARRYDHTKQNIQSGIDMIEFRKGLYHSIEIDKGNILKIAATLQVKVVTVVMKLE